MSETTTNKGATRRTLLTGAAASTAVAAASSMPTTAEAMSRVIGANNRINVAHVGLGSQGYGAHVRLIKDHEKKETPAAQRAAGA